MIGSLIQRPKSVNRNASKVAMSREYHSRHTRHIKGAQAISQNYKISTIDQLKRNAKISRSAETSKATTTVCQSNDCGTKFTSTKPSNTFRGQDEVPEGVISWYKEIIGVDPFQSTKPYQVPQPEMKSNLNIKKLHCRRLKTR